MPGCLLHAGATVTCLHGGSAEPSVSNPRVTVSGKPIALEAPHIVAKCTNNVSGVPTPCVTGIWKKISASTRVSSMGLAVLLDTSQATCIANGTPLLITVAQKRVSGM